MMAQAVVTLVNTFKRNRTAFTIQVDRDKSRRVRLESQRHHIQHQFFTINDGVAVIDIDRHRDPHLWLGP